MKTIFVVDDNVTNLTTARQALEERYKVCPLPSAARMFQMAEKITPDLILLDVIMPEMDGFEAIAKLKHDDKLRRIPVIFLTSLDDAGDEEKGLLLGAVDYITKPFHAPIMLARVKAHIEVADFKREIDRIGRTDLLTGLPNKRAFDERLNIEWRRAIRQKEPLAVLMIDVDKLSSYNDAYGHTQGDSLLKAIGGILTKNVDCPVDLASSRGGEDFFVLLPNADLDAAVKIAERIRTEAADTTFPMPDGTPTRAAISIGVNSEMPTDSSGTAGVFLAKAEGRLRAAKEAGGNRVCSDDQNGAS
ncbi:MAG: diguanylate cyclase [Chitinispirillales bacterium]|jgi:diguanylate cyclase (GGDEF)-like protein|nr:diguanylate cyclase [Chitinispirillales bacterium]